MQLRYLAFRSSKSGPPPRDPPDPRQILASIGQAVYDWDLHSDRIAWGPNAASVLGIALDAIGTGRAFAACLSHDSENSRHDAILGAAAIDAGMGAPFQICYGLTPPDGPRDATVWIEDAGRWFAGPDGRPARAHGLVRVMTDAASRNAVRSRCDFADRRIERALRLRTLSHRRRFTRGKFPMKSFRRCMTGAS